ncbi:metalloregulator ArsR/SmtB family transcription factor [Actinoplanes sp. TBRC 11911]|uniref:helix-turn-helix transcriptional regulator n=1 Tax=Actinoplanes sp. TBRC 11911 TaxID=2729386 RepID=UPI001B7D5B9D|nr:helix-turn-helix domain-containing protein [Actinoplanes sp. TBRC 11911]
MNARDVLRVLRAADQPMSIADIAARLGVHLNTVRFHLDSLTRAGRVEQVATVPTGPGRPALRFRAVRRMDSTGYRDYRMLAEILIDGFAHDPDPAASATAAGRRWGRRLGQAPDGATGNRSIAAENASAETVTAKDATAETVTAKDATAETVTAKDATAEDASAKDATAEDATAESATAQDATVGGAGGGRGGAGQDAKDQATAWLVELLGTLGFDPEMQARRIGLRDCPFLELVERGGEVVCAVHLGLMQGALEARSAPITVRRLEPFAEPDLCLAHLSEAGRA